MPIHSPSPPKPKPRLPTAGLVPKSVLVGRSSPFRHLLNVIETFSPSVHTVPSSYNLHFTRAQASPLQTAFTALLGLQEVWGVAMR